MGAGQGKSEGKDGARKKGKDKIESVCAHEEEETVEDGHGS